MVKILYTCLTAGDGVVSGVVLSRMGWPDDIAAVIACLTSEHGRWATGQVLDATGGSSLQISLPNLLLVVTLSLVRAAPLHPALQGAAGDRVIRGTHGGMIWFSFRKFGVKPAHFILWVIGAVTTSWVFPDRASACRPSYARGPYFALSVARAGPKVSSRMSPCALSISNL